jgi:hypothetical protein
MTPGVMDRMRSRHGADRWLMPCQCPRFFCPGSSRTGRLTSLRRSQLRSCRHTACSAGGIGLPKAPPSLRHIDLDQAVDDVLAPAGPRPVVHRLLDVRRRPPRGGDRILRAYRRRNQLIVFNNVDVNTQIEGEVAGQPPDLPDDSPSSWSRQTASRRAEGCSRSLVSQGPGELAPPFPGAVEFSLQHRTCNIVHIKALSARHRVIPVAVGNLRRPLRG